MRNEDEMALLVEECNREIIEFIDKRRDKYTPQIAIYGLLNACLMISCVYSSSSIDIVIKDLKERLDLGMKQMEKSRKKQEEKNGNS